MKGYRPLEMLVVGGCRHGQVMTVPFVAMMRFRRAWSVEDSNIYNDMCRFRMAATCRTRPCSRSSAAEGKVWYLLLICMGFIYLDGNYY